MNSPFKQLNHDRILYTLPRFIHPSIRGHYSKNLVYLPLVMWPVSRTFWIRSVGFIPGLLLQGGLLPSPFRRLLPEGTAAWQLSEATPSELGSLCIEEATSLPRGSKSIRCGALLGEDRTLRERKPGQRVHERNVWRGQDRCLCYLKPWATWQGVQSHARKQGMHPRHSHITSMTPWKGRENDSVVPRIPESLARAMRSSFCYTRGRRVGDLGRGSQKLGGGHSHHQKVLHICVTLSNRHPHTSAWPRALCWDWKDGSWPQPTPFLPAWVGTMWAMQLGWNLRLTHAKTWCSYLGVMGKGCFMLSPLSAFFRTSLPNSTFLMMPRTNAQNPFTPSLVESVTFPREQICTWEVIHMQDEWTNQPMKKYIYLLKYHYF